MYSDLIVAEIHRAINKLGGSAGPVTPDNADRVLRDLGADIDLISIDSWQDTLPDALVRRARNRKTPPPGLRGDISQYRTDGIIAQRAAWDHGAAGEAEERLCEPF